MQLGIAPHRSCGSAVSGLSLGLSMPASEISWTPTGIIPKSHRSRNHSNDSAKYLSSFATALLIIPGTGPFGPPKRTVQARNMSVGHQQDIIPPTPAPLVLEQLLSWFIISHISYGPTWYNRVQLRNATMSVLNYPAYRSGRIAFDLPRLNSRVVRERLAHRHTCAHHVSV